MFFLQFYIQSTLCFVCMCCPNVAKKNVQKVPLSAIGVYCWAIFLQFVAQATFETQMRHCLIQKLITVLLC